MEEENNIVEWNPTDMLEILLNEPDDFLKVRETLSRIGVSSRKEKKLFQSCHILHKQGKYYIVHFKELFLLDGKQSNFDESDVSRRNTIIDLLQQWNLISVVDKTKVEEPKAPLSQIKIVSFKEKQDWKLTAKYSIGSQNK